MTPLERMQSMQPYHNSYEGTPAHLQDKAKQLCWEYNQTSPRACEKSPSYQRHLVKRGLFKHDSLQIVANRLRAIQRFFQNAAQNRCVAFAKHLCLFQRSFRFCSATRRKHDNSSAVNSRHVSSGVNGRSSSAFSISCCFSVRGLFISISL